MKTSKASKSVPLVLLGGAVLAGCESESYGARDPGRGEYRYDYARQSDCQVDWGVNDCTTMSSSGFYHVYTRYEKHGHHATRVVRGGFGSKAKKSSSS